MRPLNLILVIVLAVLILLQRYGCKPGSWSGKKPVADTVVVIDTAYIVRNDTIIKKVKQIKQEKVHDTIHNILRVPDMSLVEIQKQYLELAGELSTRRIYYDSVALDTNGTVVRITDTVLNNRLDGRSISWTYKIPVITKKVTITEEAPKTRQMYVGGGLAANKTNVTDAHAGFLYKDLKDRVVGAYVGISPVTGQITYGLQSYWKITFKK